MNPLGKKSIFHGPMNIVGMGRHLADWQRGKGLRSDFIVYYDNPLMPNSHINLNLDKIKNRWLRWLLRIGYCIRYLFTYDIFHFYFGWSLLPRNRDLPLLKLFGKKVIMTYCGSEIRLVEREKSRNRYYQLLKVGLDHPQYDDMKIKMMKWHDRWVDHFIAPRGLYAHATSVIPASKVTENLWIHDAMNTDYFPKPTAVKNGVPVLVHAPSEKGIKGTEYIEKVIDNLHKDGYKFEYICLHSVSNEEVKDVLLNRADIVVDQLIIGGFGHLAIESMYFGKTVCSYIITEVMEECCPDCPVVNVTIDTLKPVLIRLLCDDEERERRGRAGRDFVRKHCDRRVLNERLLELYGSLYGKSGAL